MIKFFRKLFGYKEVVIVSKDLQVYKQERKYYKIIWRSVAKNFISLLKSWPRPGKYVKFYVYDRKFKKNDFTHIDPEVVEFSVQGRNTYLVEETPSSK